MANEGEAAVAFCKEALSYCAEFRKVNFFAVFDNASKDDSLEQMRILESVEPRLKVVWAPENRCAVDAYIRGYREALAQGCDWILEIDAGFSHLPREIPQFFDAIEKGKDCVFASRALGSNRESPFSRRFVSWGGTRLTNLFLGTRQTDMTSGFELFTRKTLEMVLARGIHSRAHFFQTEIKTYCRNLQWVEVPITYKATAKPLGTKPVKDAFKGLWRLFRLRLRGQH